jgi:2-(1,2-epoxy-1,2-dihydrophenyl)acetyl-CoA isomerase
MSAPDEAQREILVEHRDRVALVTLNRPDKLNAMTSNNFTELTRLFRQLGRDDDVRAVILTGTGRGFCVGADLGGPRDLQGQTPGDFAGDALHSGLTLSTRAVGECPKPVVAAVNGLAVGGGMSLALLADITVAARSARFTQVFTPKLGIVPDAGSTWLLPRGVGRARALGLMMLGEPLSGEQAAEWGLIWAAVEDTALMDEAWRIARQLAAGPTVGFGLLKRAVAASSANSLHEQLHVEAESNRIAFGTEDCSEATRAFLEKRPPFFQGR